MNKPVFTSFEEIDHKLKILRLQREIEMEQIKLHLNGAKNNLLPTALVGGVGRWSKRLLITFISRKILRKFS
ncbi:hypothetical protein KCTC52924_01324 [Arenibacter antarcticus]|uniref:DUF6327 family protein n=1 Tax=Arenibacter antarcticus TaxID=2040469 RepID=A0ABW5V9Q2_9FLAO|nr:DUF6327 family protein [Arenibacter sp. H213]MCM4167861.1 hypothetical protein [Arenibacter sp. H213]